MDDACCQRMENIVGLLQEYRSSILVLNDDRVDLGR